MLYGNSLFFVKSAKLRTRENVDERVKRGHEYVNRTRRVDPDIRMHYRRQPYKIPGRLSRQLSPVAPHGLVEDKAAEELINRGLFLFDTENLLCRPWNVFIAAQRGLERRLKGVLFL